MGNPLFRFREATVRRMFDHISLCFCDWESAQSICIDGQKCVMAAKASMNSEAKLNAILGCAAIVCEQGFGAFKAAVLEDPIVQLQKLPFVGPVTVWHLAKNLRLNVAKPDGHLTRLAEKCGYHSAEELCQDLAVRNGEKVKVVDLILWRYLAHVAGGALHCSLDEGGNGLLQPFIARSAAHRQKKFQGQSDRHRREQVSAI